MSNWISLPEVLANRTIEDPHFIVYHFYTKSGLQHLSYFELTKKAKSIAAHLQKMDCHGEKVLLLLQPGLDYITTFFGCLFAGVVPIPAYPPRRNHHNQRLSMIINNAKAKFILTNKTISEDCPSGMSIIHVDTIEDEASDYKSINIKPHDIAFIQYTSGTTGNPKGIMISHANIMSNVEIIYKNFYIPHQIISTWVPPYHDMGLIGGIIYPAYAHSAIYLMSPFTFLQSPVSWLSLISREKVTTTFAPNFSFDYCIKKIAREQINTLDLKSWQHALNGSEPVRYETIKHFCDTFAPAGFSPESIYPVYGLAETTLMVSGSAKGKWATPLTVSHEGLKENKIVTLTSYDRQNAAKLVSCGRSDSSFDIKIIDSNTLALLPDDCVGEICITGPSVALGYCDNPVLSKATFQVSLSSALKQLYLRTGDLGCIHEGELYVTGRIKDIIIIRGFKYYPQDIEYTVMNAYSGLPAYATAVFTHKKHDEEQLVVLQEIAQHSATDLDVQSIFREIRAAVSKEHGLTLHSIVLLKPRSLLRTSSGKIQRSACREAFIDKKLRTVAYWDQANVKNLKVISNNSNNENISSNSIYLWLKKWLEVQTQFSLNEIELNKSPTELGLNSLTAVELAADLKNEFNKEIDPAFILQLSTFSELLSILNENKVNITSSQTIARAPLVAAEKHPLSGIAKEIYFQEVEGLATNLILINKQQYINYSSYNYLGMSGDPYVTEAAINAIKTYGTSVSASRIASGHKTLHTKLERELANLIGTDDCIVYSAGHATNISVITHLFGSRDLIIYDTLCHNSILQGIRFSGAQFIEFPHNDYFTLEKLLIKNQNKFSKTLIVTEGIFSMDGDIPEVPRIVELKKRYHAYLMIDEAHSIGTLGKSGCGIREYFNLHPSDVDIWMGTLSKSFASCGGFIAGSNELIENLKYHAAGFVYSAGITPANTAAALAAVQLMKLQPERLSTLNQRQNLLLSLLKNAEIPIGESNNTPIIPIMLVDDKLALDASLILKQHGIYALPILYPAVAKGKARIRLFISSLHTEEQIQYTAQIIKEKIPVSLQNVSSISESC